MSEAALRTITALLIAMIGLVPAYLTFASDKRKRRAESVELLATIDQKQDEQVRVAVARALEAENRNFRLVLGIQKLAITIGAWQTEYFAWAARLDGSIPAPPMPPEVQGLLEEMQEGPAPR